MSKAKEVFLCACSIYSYFIDKQVATYKTYQAIEYLGNLLEYNSSRDPNLKFQNEGNGARQLRQGFSMKMPIMDNPIEVKHLK